VKEEGANRYGLSSMNKRCGLRANARRAHHLLQVKKNKFNAGIEPDPSTGILAGMLTGVVRGCAEN